MNFKAIINTDLNCKAKYEYYHSLGYSEKASEILSTVTYGDELLHRLMKKMESPDAMEKLHAWLSKRKERTPEEALYNTMDKRRRNIPYSAGFGGGFGGAGSAMFFSGSGSKGMSPDGVSYECEDDDCYYDSAEDMMDDDNSVGQVCCAMQEPTMNRSAFVGSAIPASMNMASFMENIATDQYETIEEKGAQDPLSAPTSTFRMTTNTASVGIILNQIRENRGIDISQVRMEELMNYFRYQVKPPKKKKFRISTEQMKKSDEKELLYVHVGAKEETKDGQNIVLLLDVSGSMSSQTEVTQLAIATIVSKLHPGDRFSLITYSDKDEKVFKGHKIKDEHDKEQIMAKILSIVIDGCTNGSAGIETAYRIGEKHYDADKNNQVILITDGDLNFGITAKDGLIGLIEEKKKSNLFLSVIGTGLYNYKDDNLEALAKHGNGTYCVVNNLADVMESINRRYISLTNIVAKDVKAQ
ncbi:MAG: von Willebrand factor type A domain-containing protein, partial [Clostridiales bacterium]|nr:von Willebrand factor type A domain-containing protein [Clostridiales bacterium]